ncbi:hypothetical protein MKY41_04570 [Sporosarcina sp. FSL W7-1349]|uniref:hypothetical protein n=1 Tax=Sporosarcina sp. FSL W7-1349 TaxID=2921561 RepID=UPI0030FB7FF7
MAMESTSNIFPFEDYAKMEYDKPPLPQDISQIISQNSFEIGYTKENDPQEEKGGENIMQSKEYIDVRIDALEKNISQRFQAQENLFSEKLNTLSAKFDGQHNLIVNKIDSLSDGIKKDIDIITQKKIDDFQETLDKQKRENKSFTWMVVGIAVAAATLMATLVPIIF